MLGAYENSSGSQIDRLTGLPTRELFDEELARQIREHPGGFGLLCGDADDLKNINDTLGHPAGDELLIEIASVLQDTFRHEVKGEERELDYVGRAVFRLTRGDEFGIILAGADTPEKVDAARDRAQKALAKRNIRFSMGGRPHREGEPAEKLVYDVDQMAKGDKIERLPDLSTEQQAEFARAMRHLEQAGVSPRDASKYFQKYGRAVLAKTLKDQAGQAS